MASRKKEKKPELTEDEKFIAGLANEVSTYLTLHKAAYFGHAKNLERLFSLPGAGAGGLGASASAAAAVPADAYDVDSGNTALILASRNGHLKAAQVLLDKGKASVNLAGFGGLTALHHACMNDHQEVVNLLLDQGKAQVNVEDDAGNTPVSLCARMGNLKCLEALASRGASLDHANKRGCTPLGFAVTNARMAVVEWFLRKPGVNLNHMDREGNTPLHYAAALGHTRIVRTLLTAAAKPGIDNMRSERPEDVAFSDTIKALLKTSATYAD